MTGDARTPELIIREERPARSALPPDQSAANPAPARPIAPASLFSHSESDSSSTTTPRETKLNWKGSFQPVRPTAIMIDSHVVRRSAEMPIDAVQTAMLPTPQARPTAPPEPQTPDQPSMGEPPPPVRVPAGSSTESNSAPLPTLENQLAGHPLPREKCSSPWDLRSIRAIDADINIKAADQAGSKPMPPECSLGDTPFRPRNWQKIQFAWTAASTCHNPIYFEDERLERYGNSLPPALQTTFSAVRFFATVPLTPYFMGVYPSNECIYDLGTYRPGSCAPFYLDPLPLSVRGTLYEGMFLGILPAL